MKKKVPVGYVDLYAGLKERTGCVKYKDSLIDFLYILMRDYLPPGKVEEIIVQHVSRGCGAQEQTSEYTNGYLAKYAEDVSLRLRGKKVNRNNWRDKLYEVLEEARNNENIDEVLDTVHDLLDEIHAKNEYGE